MPYRRTRRNTLRRKGRGIKTVVVPRNPNNIERAVATAATGVTGAMINQAMRSVGEYVKKSRSFPQSRAAPPPQPKSKVVSTLYNKSGEFGGTIKLNYNLNPGLKPLSKRMLKLGFNHRVLRFQRCNVMNAGVGIPGNCYMYHGTIDADKTAAPAYFMCLNQTNNQGSLTGGPFRRLQFTDVGNVEFPVFQNQNPDGTFTQDKWIADFVSPAFNSGVTDPELRYIMESWYDVRLNLYGTTSQPTIYDIMVVSFKDHYLDPYEQPSNAQEVADRHSVYQGLVQKYMTNPILPVKYPRNKYVVHARKRVVIQPTLNIENDTSPNNKIVRMFIKDGSTYDYCYHGDGFGGAGADDKLSTVQYTVQGASATLDYSDVPQPKARKWLIIRSLNTTRVTLGSETRANTPSFDLVVRKGEYCQAR